MTHEPLLKPGPSIQANPHASDIRRDAVPPSGNTAASLIRIRNLVHPAASTSVTPRHRDLRTLPCKLAAGLLILAALSGCSTLEYYRHALVGQMEIWRGQESIAELLDSGTLAPGLRDKLIYATSARDFAFDSLALPDNGSYRTYVDLEREFVVWNVFAAPELSLNPVESCYPFAGCFGYRGFFRKDRALRHANDLKENGFEVYVGGVSAYSTLGWLDDPVLSSILKWEKPRIAEIIFHELAHQRLYVKDDTTFNESFAMAVATAGLQRWIPLQNGNIESHVTEKQRESEFIALILRFRQELETLFSSAWHDARKREVKHEILDRLDAEYRTLKTSWNGNTSYDEWMQNDLNNAKIASISTYHDHADAFTSILERYDHDFSAFYAAVEAIAALEPPERTACLNALAGSADFPRSCPQIPEPANP